MENVIERILSSRAVRKLSKRPRLPVDAGRSIAIKRDVHEFLVAAEPARLAAAFEAVMTDPRGMFGLIRVKRPDERMGRAFAVGERFQGCYSLAAALLGVVSGRARRLLGWLLGRAPLRWLVARLEDALLSDYAVIDELELDPAPGRPHALQYSYLAGTPIAGSSRFTIEAHAGGSRVTQIFEYQEVNAIALGTFQRFGLKMHDQVVHRQIAQAAARAGAPAPTGTIPLEYT
jgi:hypothetical protein